MTTTEIADQTQNGWRAPVVGWLSVASLYLVSATSRGVWTAHAAANRWWESIDATLPELTARWLLHGAHGELISGWHASDRGPLQALMLLWAGEWSSSPVPAYVAGVVINASWVLGLWVFLRALDVPERRIRFTVVLLGVTGAVWLNTVYPWPKMLSGALSLGCAAALLRRRPVIAGVLGGLALLAHGAALFALVGLVPWAVARLGRRALVVLAIVAAVYAPWWGFAKIVDPPGDRLIKWHLAGTAIEHPDPRPPLTAIVSQYRDAGVGTVIGNKVKNLRLVAGDPSVWEWTDGPWTPRWTDLAGELRTWQVTRLAWAPGLLLIGLLGWRRVPRTLWAMIGSWTAAYVLIEFGGSGPASTWLHTAPYALVLAWIGACALGCNRWVLAAQTAAFVGLWFLAPSAF